MYRNATSLAVQASRWGPAGDNVTGTVVVAAEFALNTTQWMSNVPYRVVWMHKGKEVEPGQSGYADFSVQSQDHVEYLEFIVQNYDDLPPRMIFVNGRRSEARPVRGWMGVPCCCCFFAASGEELCTLLSLR